MSHHWREIRQNIPNLLFIIEKSNNENIVVYEALNGDINQIDSYWLLAIRQTNKNREELSWFEKKCAYGFTLKNNTIHMNAFESLPIMLGTTIHKRPIATMMINGKQCRLESIYAHMEPNAILNVKRVTIVGTDLQTFETQKQDVLRQ
jgi:hypothetical protein